jgi:Flp pilus assembly protein CpaB
MAVLAFGAVFLLASTFGSGGGGGPTTKAVVAKQDIPLRHVITDSDLDLANVSGSFGTLIYANKTDVINLISQIKISKGSVITVDMLARDINIVPGGAAPAYLPLAKGFVAMTIPTGEIQGVAGHISIGDYITVIASGNVSIFQAGATAPTGPVKVVSKTVFYNLRVIGLGPATAGVQPAGGTGGGGGSAATTGVTSSLTIELSQCDAEYFTWFLNNMTLRYTLESYKDYLATPPTDNSDPSCPNLKDPSGVSQTKVDTRFGFTRL